GAGKTKLVSKVVDDLLDTFQRLPNDEALAYFYCDRNQPDRRDPDLILSSFVRQLSTFQNDDAIPRPTLQMYNQKQQTGFASGKLKLEESRTVLADLLEIYPQITLVVDALDECNKNTRSTFIKALDKLVDESPKPIKIFISSRRDRGIKHRFENGPNLEIRAIDNRDDIAIFVSHEITSSQTLWQNDISSELKETICNTLVDRSKGMFQWASLQITALRELCRESDIRNRLGKLPKTLRTAYDELYLKIQSQEESTPEIANRVFQWVMCSGWPLSPAELVAAVCQNPNTDEIDEVDININTVLGACQNLLVVDQESNVCRFSHLSVQEYFETYHWSSGEGDCLVGKVCLLLLINNNSATLKQDTLPTKKLERDERTHCVLKYACRNWVTHIQRIEGKETVENRLTTLLKRFLGSMDQSSLPYQNWHKMLGKRFHYSTLIWHKDYSSRSFRDPPLDESFCLLSPHSRASFAIVAFGFYRTILDWWTVGFADVNEKNSKGYSLLLLGVMGGSVSIAGDLLKKGANVNAAGGYLDNPLQAASALGDETMVQLLLDNGADINASGGRYGNALQAASSYGYKSIIKLLLDKGADVNTSGGHYGSALSAASYSGHESVMRLLLDKGADVNASGGHYGSALSAASNSGHESVMRLLLDKGADINASGRHYGSALSAASYSGQESVMRLLLDKGADINASGGHYGSALLAASVSGRESVVQLLLDNGADINTSGGHYGNALSAASCSGIESVVRLLLDNGADVNASGGKYGSALSAASYWGHKSVARLLLDKGADVDAAGGEFGSALDIASSCGDEAVVQLLQAAMKH
ncbi:hypothetical protein MMC22_011265, partial [Lobaria immixta]|nr:hypothetical protein [Lobaria immixta]